MMYDLLRKAHTVKSWLLALSISAACLGGCGHPFEVATPTGFVDLSDSYDSNEYRATTADGVVLGVRAFDNEPRGELAFWSQAIENRIRDLGGYTLAKKSPVTSKLGQGTELQWTRDEDGKPQRYALSVFVTDKRVYVVEYGGAADKVAARAGALDAAVQGLSSR